MYSFSAVNNHKLNSLWDWNQHNLTIRSGRLFFRQNPMLCMNEIRKMWDKTGITMQPEEADFLNNGERASCEYINWLICNFCWMWAICEQIHTMLKGVLSFSWQVKAIFWRLRLMSPQVIQSGWHGSATRHLEVLSAPLFTTRSSECSLYWP